MVSCDWADAAGWLALMLPDCDAAAGWFALALAAGWFVLEAGWFALALLDFGASELAIDLH